MAIGIGGGVTEEGPDITSGLSNLFKNKLFLQMLAAGGQDIAETGTFGKNLSGAVQQNIATQNYAKILQKILAGEVEGGKATMSDKGLAINVPKSALDFGKGTGEYPGGSFGSPAGAKETVPQEAMDLVNPSPGPLGTSPGAGLAGLTTKDLSSLLQGAMGVEALGQKRITDVADVLYKGALTDQAAAIAARTKAGPPLDRPFPVGVPGVGSVTLRQWNTLPADDKEYAIYVHAATELGDEDIMSKQEWLATDPTEREKFIRAALKDPKIMAAAKDLARSGATILDLGTYRARAKIKGEEAAIADVLSPDFHQNVMEDLSKDKRKWRATTEAEEMSKGGDISFEDARTRIQRGKVIDEMGRRIRAAFVGKEVTARSDGWYVDGELVQRNPYGR